MNYVVCEYELARGEWKVVRVVDHTKDLREAREKVRRLQRSLPGGGITRCYGIATIDI